MSEKQICNPSIYENWIKNNIFTFKKGDGVAYLILYILIPVTITAVSLSVLPKDSISIIYCYITILINALNSMYDVSNRWNSGKKTVNNSKLFIILLSDLVVAGYCGYVVLNILISKNIGCRVDWIFLVYFFTVVVAIVDIGACFAYDMALRDCV